jgi:restriction system protein
MKRPFRSRLSILHVFILLPSWVSLGLGGLLYALIEWYQRTHSASASNPVLTIASSVYAPAVLTIFLGAAVIGELYRAKRFRNLEQQTGIESLKIMRWKDFEHLVAEVYERLGFAVSCALENGPDGGIDVVLKKDGCRTIVQCKCWRTWSVGVTKVREMFGILHHEGAHEAIIVTTGDFTEAARDFAKGKPIALVDGQALWDLVCSVKTSAPLNRSAPKSDPSTTPACPDCGSAMLERTARRGAAAGKQFWGCSKYPACQTTRSIS